MNAKWAWSLTGCADSNERISTNAFPIQLSMLANPRRSSCHEDKAKTRVASSVEQKLNKRNIAHYWQYLQREQSLELNNSIFFVAVQVILNSFSLD
jgi:hypothetical protein